jgi:predicted nucleic acid-binding Zn ribbon protein
MAKRVQTGIVVRRERPLPEAKRCPVCGDLFPPKEDVQTYCTNRCRGVAQSRQAQAARLKLR